jgi:hypothetical protein
MNIPVVTVPDEPTRRFVVLEHVWNGVHWDLMLDTGESLQTWAIDAPIVPGRALPARKLGDHRRAYLEYEGEISGNRGSVRRVEQGTYEVEVWTDDRVVVRLFGAQLVGTAELRKTDPGGAIETPGVWIFCLGNFH